MASDFTWGKVLGLILIILVLVIVIFGIVKFRSSGLLDDLIPDFIKGEKQIIQVGDEKLLQPELIKYQIQASDADIFFWYDETPTQNGTVVGPATGWKWRSLEASQEADYKQEGFWGYHWNRNVAWIWNSRSQVISGWHGTNEFDLKSNQVFLNLIEKDQDFIRNSIRGKTPEEGLENIVRRVTVNKEGNWFKDVVLRIYVTKNFNDLGNPKITYKASNKNLIDLDGLIIRLNQISRHVK